MPYHQTIYVGLVFINFQLNFYKLLPEKVGFCNTRVFVADYDDLKVGMK